jgi:hypothetical protein
MYVECGMYVSCDEKTDSYNKIYDRKKSPPIFKNGGDGGLSNIMYFDN